MSDEVAVDPVATVTVNQDGRTLSGVGVDPAGQFLHQIRRVATRADFFRVCEEFLNHDQPMPLEPFPLSLKETDVMAGEQL